MTDQNEHSSAAQANNSNTPNASQPAANKKSKLAVILILLLAVILITALVATITAVLQSRSVSELFVIASIVVIIAFLVGRAEGAARPKQISSKALKGLTRGLFGLVNLCLLALTASIALVGLKQQDSATLTPVFSISAEQQNSSALYQQACAWLKHFPNNSCQVSETTVVEALEPLPVSETPSEADSQSQEPATADSNEPLSTAVEMPSTEPTEAANEANEANEAPSAQQAEAEVTSSAAEAVSTPLETEPSTDSSSDAQTASDSDADTTVVPSEQPQATQP